MTATCYACESGSNTCTKENSALASTNGKGVARYASGVTFTFKQDGTKSTDVLKVKDVMHCPNSKGAVGRFAYKPQTTMSLYAANSKISYTFGTQAFGTGAICQVFTSSGTKPSMTPSDLVSKCEIAGSVIDVTMAKSSTANFHVVIVGMAAWSATAGKVTGTVTTYTSAV